MIKNEDIVRSLIALTARQKDSMDLFARNITRKRESKTTSEKITISTLIRCMANVFMKRWGVLSIEDVHSEEELQKRINALFD